ncbi:uncharacterized protein LOC121390620 [Gigantopelta aegis]|uniref:uncharacterized protein LOC121390620 n=1 Tax=Gigantopelta aegis TaxID=1735272 RepID=UPI001B88967A|nr:uncharacterized protein LOC121390620 [Gigantopelta aegis]XP_041378417.1 uncharacterized protein LOC121390620 [Gigantopelta aegis]
MNGLVFLSLLAVAMGQLFPFFPWGSQGDRIHGYHFVYHDNNDLLVIRNSDSCYLVEISADLRNDMHHKDTREKIEDQLYKQIKNNEGISQGNHDEIRDKYHDRLDSFLCVRHQTFHLVYQAPA